MATLVCVFGAWAWVVTIIFMEKVIMEENKERIENELPADTEDVNVTEGVTEGQEQSNAPSSPKKPPMNTKVLIAAVVGAVAVVALVLGLVFGLGGKGHTCSFGEWTVVTQATCTEEGVRERSCSCGEKETEAIAAVGHSWKDATCQSPKMCNSCYATEGEAGAHAYTESVITGDALKSSASCSSAAVYYKSCICGKISKSDGDTFTSGSATAHYYVKISSTDADCENGATETYACDCGSEYTDTVSPALGHNVKDVTPVKRPVEGSVCEYVWVYTCANSGCGDEVIGESVYYHSYNATITTYPTCKDDGIKTLTCSDCGDSYTEAVEKNSTGHKWVKGELVNGVRVDSCEYCSETKNVTVYEGTSTDSINSGSLKDTEIELNDTNISLDDGVVDSIGDKSVTISAEKLGNEDVEDLLTQDQLDQVGDSPIYNFTINDGNENISKFGENNYVTITLPYTLKDGEDVDSIAIWFIADDGQLESIKATYNNGYVTFKTNHFSYYTVTRLTPAERCNLYGHNYSEKAFEGSCTADGYLLKVCVRCHKTEKTVTSVASGHEFKTEIQKPSCTENGYTVYSCNNCDYSYTITESATGHSWEKVSSEESTCSKNGYESFECTGCGEKYTETLPKLEHQMVEEKIIKDATCVDNGSKVIICVCGETVQLEIPATGKHTYENGVCKSCGAQSSAKVEIDGVVIRIKDFSFVNKEKEDKDSAWEVIGSLKQIDIAELMIYVEDGKLHGAAIGSVEYYDKWDGTASTYALTAIIEDDCLYYHIDAARGTSNQTASGKISLEELLYESILPDKEITDEMLSFCQDTIIPAIELLVDHHSENIDEAINDLVNIFFTTETLSDGSRVISLDPEKLNALNENLATLTIAEVIELYFGEGVVDEIYDAVIDILNTEITDIPELINEEGIDAEKLIDDIERLCEVMELPVNIDLKDILYGEDYADTTIGMLIFGTEDKSYVEKIDEMLELIRENTLYQLISEEKPEDIKKTVGEAIDFVTDSFGIAFTVNSAGQLVDIDLDVNELVIENEESYFELTAKLDVSFTDRIDVTWSDIIDNINSDLFRPDDEILDFEAQNGSYQSSGSMTYKGESYEYNGQGFYSYVADYDRLVMQSAASNCGDWRYYSRDYATVGYEISLRRLYSEKGSEKEEYTLAIDVTTNEIVELEMKQNGATAHYEDGSTKELTSDDLSSLEKLYKAIFGEVMHENFHRRKYISFYYNAKTGEYSYDSMHDYEILHTVNGGSCENGVVTTHTCKNCGDHYTETYDHHRNYREEIDLTPYGACEGVIEIYTCACGKQFNVYYYNSCGYSNYNEYYDEEGRLVKVSTRSCRDCGLMVTESSYTGKVEGACQEMRSCKLVINVGSELVLNKELTSVYESHDYKTVGRLMDGAASCEDGVILTYTCRDCGYSYTNETHWHESYVLESVDLAALGSLCGGYAELTGCACGKYTNFSLNHSLCEFNHRYCNIWIDGVITGDQYTADGNNWYSHDSWIYVCAVTDPEACPFKIRYASYWLDNGNCSATLYKTWQFGYNEATGSYAKEITLEIQSRNYHNYVETALTNGVKYSCPDCGSYYSDISYFDRDGNCVKDQTIASNTLPSGNRYRENTWEYEYNAEGERISEYNYTKIIREDGTVSEEYNKNIRINDYYYTEYNYSSNGNYWYRYDYTYDFSSVCTRTATYTNSNGAYEVITENCCRNSWDTIKNPTCTQDGLEGEYCMVCNAQNETYVIDPSDHNWVFIGDHYYCFRCGLENSNGISGDIILEDLTNEYGNESYYVVGYYAKNNVTFTYYVSLVLDDETEIILEGISFIDCSDIRAIKFSKSAVERAITNQGYSIDDGDVRFAFVPYGADGSFDYAITFTKTVNIDTIVDDVSFVEYVGTEQTLSFTIAPLESGYWSFSSLADNDSYAYLCDSNGNEIWRDDDGGYNSNFMLNCYLEAGETYTLYVRWYSSSTSGNMPLVFNFEG